MALDNWPLDSLADTFESDINLERSHPPESGSDFLSASTELDGRSVETFKLFHSALPDANADLFEQAILDKALSLKSFHEFPKLPLELRLKIWKLAFPPPRGVGIGEDCVAYNFFSEQFEIQLPVTLFVNHESREETFRSFTLFYTTRTHTKETCCSSSMCKARRAFKKPVFFNNTQDVAFLHGLILPYFEFDDQPLSEHNLGHGKGQLEWMQSVQRVAGNEVFAKIKTLLILNVYIDYMINNALKNDGTANRFLPLFEIFGFFRGLRKLIVAVSGYDRHRVKLRRTKDFFELFLGMMQEKFSFGQDVKLIVISDRIWRNKFKSEIDHAVMIAHH